MTATAAALARTGPWPVRIARRPAEITGAWEHVLDELEATTLAHERQWLDVISRAYGHRPLYAFGEDAKRQPGVLPAFIVHRPLLGPVVTSMPFLDSGGPVARSEALRRALVEQLVGEARACGATRVEIRSTERLDLPGAVREDKVNMVLELEGDPDALWRRLDGGVRNQIRKAGRSGLSVDRCGADGVHAFYPVFAARMHDLGSPVHARSFFSAVFDAFRTRASVFLVRKGPEVIGGLIAIAYKRAVAVPWAACLQEHFRLCPNMLLYWEAIRSAAAAGAGRFEFGRSTRGSGTYRFKRQWGAIEQPLFWYDLPTVGTRARPSAPSHRVFLEHSWRRLPRSLTARLGPIIRRYLTQ